MSLDWDFFWRESLGDGVYSISGTPLRTGVGGSRYVGNSSGGHRRLERDAAPHGADPVRPLLPGAVLPGQPAGQDTPTTSPCGSITSSEPTFTHRRIMRLTR